MNICLCAYLCALYMYIYMYTWVQLQSKILRFDFAGPTTDNYKVSTWQFSWGNTYHLIPNLMHIQWTLNTESSCNRGPRPVHTVFLCILGFSYQLPLLEASHERERRVQLIFVLFRCLSQTTLLGESEDRFSWLLLSIQDLHSSHPASVFTRLLGP